VSPQPKEQGNRTHVFLHGNGLFTDLDGAMSKHRDEFFSVAVSCYAGYKGEQTPRSFVLEGNEHRVNNVLECWYERSVNDFSSQYVNWRVTAGDNHEYILRYDQKRDRWNVRLVGD
jgi:hypothetical protein